MPGKRPPTTHQLITLLGKVRVKCIRRFPNSDQVAEWRPYEEQDDDEIQGDIVLATDSEGKRGMDALIQNGLHELCHAFFQVNCQDDRAHHDKVYRWELLLFRSRALREAMAVRIGNSYIYGVEEP